MNILITGGNGFIGRHLTLYLCRSHDVTVVDNLRVGGRLRFSDRELQHFRFVHLDITDGKALRQCIEQNQPEVVVHLAALHHIPECNQHPYLATHINAVGTVSVLKACAGVVPRVVYASTAAVYAPSEEPHKESDPLAPMDIYGLTKLFGEQVIHLFAQQCQIKCAILRLFNIFGKGETNPHLIPELLDQLATGSKLRVGNLYPKRDYIHVQDVVRAIAMVTLPDNQIPQKPVAVYNVGTGTAFSVREVIQVLSDAVGRPLDIETVGERQRKIDRPFLCADISRIKAEIDWEPALSFHAGLQKLVESLK